MKEVIIVIPIYRDVLEKDEIISLNQCLTVLGDYDIAFVAPQRVTFQNIKAMMDTIQIVRFPDKYFEDIKGYNELLLSMMFYRRFETYKYMLIYQLDALVFNDQLMHWCSKGYDYIGAPWFAEYSRDKSKILMGVGNGGLSLRNIGTFINVLSSTRLYKHYDKFSVLPVGFGFKQIIFLRCLLKLSTYIKVNYLKVFLAYFKCHEDIFWSAYAQFYVEEFKIPNINEALLFAFEMHPQYCFDELTNGILPFGCHKWGVYNRAFWIDILKNCCSTRQLDICNWL